MYRLLPIALTLLATTAVSAAGAGPAGRRFDVRGFHAIDLTGPDDVRVVSGAGFSVIATGDPRAIEALAIEVRGDTLRVGRRQGSWRDRGAIVTVSMPDLRGVTISGSGDVDAARAAGDGFAGRVSGSGDLRVRELSARDARLEVSGSGDVVVDGRVSGELAIANAGSGDITARGSAGSVAVRVTGSGDVDIAAMTAGRLRIDASGSGSVKARATGTAEIAASGSADVTVGGHPRCTVRKNAAADVTCG